MADDGGVRRPKTAEKGVVMAEAADAAELRVRIAELESENEQLRRREGNHEVLPVVIVVAAAVDLSRVDSSIVIHISSFLGTSHELLNLALACKCFGWRQPSSTLKWSLVEEIARQTVCFSATDDEMSSLPKYVSRATTWLSILHRFEHLLVFDVLLGGCIEHTDGNKAAVRGAGDYGDVSTVISSGCVMRSGIHYAEFQINGPACIGIVRPMPGLDAGAYQDFPLRSISCETNLYPDFLAQRSDDWSDGNVHACDYSCGAEGTMGWTNWDDEGNEELDWDGMEGCGTGDVLGMLLDLEEGTLTVYKNNRHLGSMKGGLSGPYCWYAEVGRDETVAIRRATRPNPNN